MSNYSYPQDEFDVAEDERVPVGVHRASVPAWRSWLPLLIILVVVPALAWGAVKLRGTADSKSTSASTASAKTEAGGTPAAQGGGGTAGSTGSAEQTAAPTQATPGSTPTPTRASNADLTTGITVYNGTTTNGLAGRTGSRLENAGYTGVSVPDGSYQKDSPEATTVYYRPESAATARAVASLLGISNLVESPEEAQSNPIVVILRSDFSE